MAGGAEPIIHPLRKILILKQLICREVILDHFQHVEINIQLLIFPNQSCSKRLTDILALSIRQHAKARQPSTTITHTLHCHTQQNIIQQRDT